MNENDYVLGSESDEDEKSNYRLRNALKVPRATTYTAQALYDQIHASDINLEPEYQRAVVWPEAKQIGIIDSILRNFYIPPVIFCVNVYEDGTETKTCIDGKQRLTSIHRFMSGLIPHRDPYTGDKYWYKDVGSGSGRGHKRKLLPEKYRRTFANKQIVCVEYSDITDGDEREIFQRVQLGMALTPAEKIQVISSPRATFIRELQSIYLQETGGLVGESLNWDRSRGGDFRSLAQAVYSIEKYPSSSITLAPLERWLTQPDATITDTFREHIHTTFRVLVELVHDEALGKPFQKPAKVAPIELIMIVVLVATHMRSMGLSQLSAAIGGMREEVRKQHVDIRMNDRVAKTMLEYVKGCGKRVDGDAGDAPLPDVKKRKRESKDDKEAGEIPEPPTRIQAVPQPSSSTSFGPRSAQVDRLAALHQAKQSAQRLPTNRQLPAPTVTPHTPSSLNAPSYRQPQTQQRVKEEVVSLADVLTNLGPSVDKRMVAHGQGHGEHDGGRPPGAAQWIRR